MLPSYLWSVVAVLYIANDVTIVLYIIAGIVSTGCMVALRGILVQMVVKSILYQIASFQLLHSIIIL